MRKAYTYKKRIKRAACAMLAAGLVFTGCPEVFLSQSVLKVHAAQGYESLVKSCIDNTPAVPVTYGDANGDGKIDSRDAVLIKKYIAGFTGFTIDLEASDVNADGKVDTRDAVKILKKIAGFDVTLGAA